jgi:predicted alpha/beta superfamily hydrolase
MRNLLIACLLFISLQLTSQYKVGILVNSLPDYTDQNDTLFVAGSFNGWNPHSNAHMMVKEEGRYVIYLQLPAGMHEFKITRGSWEKVESGNKGFPVENHSIRVGADTNVYLKKTFLKIEHWADHFPKTLPESSANKNVKIIEQAFFIPQLNRYRRVWIYLPVSYSSSKKDYPVLYMHDGQNVFEDTTSFSGEWGVDEALDTLGSKYGEMIVVAIDNGGSKRMNEYSPYDMDRFGNGEGDAYVDFLVKTLKPYIHKHYRSSKKTADNYVAGSSMGGLISLYAILKYPKEFGGAGVFSPAFWIAPGIKDAVNEKAKEVKGKIYFYAGKKESDSMVPDMLKIFEMFRHLSKAKMETVIREEGKHNEATWRKEFPLFYRWLWEK